MELIEKAIALDSANDLAWFYKAHLLREMDQMGEKQEGTSKRARFDRLADEAEVRFGKYTAIVNAKSMGGSGKKPAAELQVGFLPEFEVKKVNDDNQTLEVSLIQVPEVQASIVSLNAKTGEIVEVTPRLLIAGRVFRSLK